MSPLNRREFIEGVAAAGVAGAAAVGLAGCSNSTTSSSTGTTAGTSPGTTATTRPPLPDPAKAPFDTVVVLMMENRSFDHLLGWLPGANGKQAGLSYVDATGKSWDTWPLAPDWQGCTMQDPSHLWQSMQTAYNNGACDGFMKTSPTDQFPIGYYVAEDLPIMATLAQNYTCLDNYFCSMLGPTWPNRLYQLCGQTDIDYTGLFPPPGGPYPTNLETAIFDVVQAAGLSTGYYSYGEPMTGLFTSQKYNDITYPIERFFTDAQAGTLPNVTFVDPDYTFHSEFNGTSNDYHPYGSVQAAEEFLATVHDALAKGPQWERMVFVLNFDESGGFYDHVPPPRVQDQSVLQDIQLNDLPGPDLTRLGFRVPAIVMGPYAPKKIDSSGPYEHCSVLNMIEWRWGLQPMTVRDRTANNLANVLDFTTTRPAVTMPPFTPAPAAICPPEGHFP